MSKRAKKVKATGVKPIDTAVLPVAIQRLTRGELEDLLGDRPHHEGAPKKRADDSDHEEEQEEWYDSEEEDDPSSKKRKRKKAAPKKKAQKKAHKNTDIQVSQGEKAASTKLGAVLAIPAVARALPLKTLLHLFLAPTSREFFQMRHKPQLWHHIKVARPELGLEAKQAIAAVKLIEESSPGAITEMEISDSSYVSNKNKTTLAYSFAECSQLLKACPKTVSVLKISTCRANDATLKAAGSHFGSNLASLDIHMMKANTLDGVYTLLSSTGNLTSISIAENTWRGPFSSMNDAKLFRLVDGICSARGFGGFSVLQSLTLPIDLSMPGLSKIAQLVELRHLSVHRIAVEGVEVTQPLFQRLESIEVRKPQAEDFVGLLRMFANVKSIKLTAERHTPVALPPPSVQPLLLQNLVSLEFGHIDFGDFDFTDTASLGVLAPALEEFVLVASPALSKPGESANGLQKESLASVARWLNPRSNDSGSAFDVTSSMVNSWSERVTLKYPASSRDKAAASITTGRVVLERTLFAAVSRDAKLSSKMAQVLGEERLVKEMQPPPVFAEELRSDTVGSLFVRLADSSLIAIFKEVPTLQKLMLCNGTCRPWRRLRDVNELWEKVELVHIGFGPPDTKIPVAFGEELIGTRGSGADLTTMFSRVATSCRELVLMETGDVGKDKKVFSNANLMTIAKAAPSTLKSLCLAVSRCSDRVIDAMATRFGASLQHLSITRSDDKNCNYSHQSTEVASGVAVVKQQGVLKLVQSAKSTLKTLELRSKCFRRIVSYGSFMDVRVTRWHMMQLCEALGSADSEVDSPPVALKVLRLINTDVAGGPGLRGDVGLPMEIAALRQVVQKLQLEELEFVCSEDFGDVDAATHMLPDSVTQEQRLALVNGEIEVLDLVPAAGIPKVKCGLVNTDSDLFWVIFRDSNELDLSACTVYHDSFFGITKLHMNSVFSKDPVKLKIPNALALPNLSHLTLRDFCLNESSFGSDKDWSSLRFMLIVYSDVQPNFSDTPLGVKLQDAKRESSGAYAGVQRIKGCVDRSERQLDSFDEEHTVSCRAYITSDLARKFKEEKDDCDDCTLPSWAVDKKHIRLCGNCKTQSETFVDTKMKLDFSVKTTTNSRCEGDKPDVEHAADLPHHLTADVAAARKLSIQTQLDEARSELPEVQQKCDEKLKALEAVEEEIKSQTEEEKSAYVKAVQSTLIDNVKASLNSLPEHTCVHTVSGKRIEFQVMFTACS